MMDHWKTGIRIVGEGTLLDSTQEKHQCMLSGLLFFYSYPLAFFLANQELAIKILAFDWLRKSNQLRIEK